MIYQCEIMAMLFFQTNVRILRSNSFVADINNKTENNYINIKSTTFAHMTSLGSFTFDILLNHAKVIGPNKS